VLLEVKMGMSPCCDGRYCPRVRFGVQAGKRWFEGWFVDLSQMQMDGFPLASLGNKVSLGRIQIEVLGVVTGGWLYVFTHHKSYQQNQRSS